MDKSVSLARMLLVLAMVTLTASFSTSSFADACPSNKALNSAHISAGRANGCGLMNYYACTTGDGENLGGASLAMDTQTTIYEGDDGKWYKSDPADCGSGGGSPPAPTPTPAASFTLTSGSGSDGSGVRPNIILAMNDSFLMNSEVLWTAAAGRNEFADTSRLNEMFVNRDTFSFQTDSTVSYVPNYDLQPSASNGLRVYGAGTKATSIMYNLLAYNPNVRYTPWPGYPSKDMAQCNSARDGEDPTSNTPNENTYCPKYFPEYTNTLEGNVTGANSSSPSASLTVNSKHFVLDECLHTGCKSFVAISPTTALGRALTRPGEASICGYLSTYQLSGNRGDCVDWHFRPIWESYATPLGKLNAGWSSDPVVDINSCNTTMITAMSSNPQACFEYNPSTGKWDGSANAAFGLTCDTQFDMKMNWPCSGYTGTTRYVTNILNKGQLESQYYVDTDGTTVVYVASLSADNLNNYANWFTYYRTLGHIQKGAMLAVAYEAKDNDRIGIADSTGVTTNIAAMSSGRATINTAIAQKRASFTTLYNKMLSTIDNTYAHLKNNNQYLYNTMSSPIDTSDSTANCRQNHILMFASGEWNEPSVIASLSGTPDNLANMADYAYKSDIGASIENFVPTDDYSDQNIQHVKTWIMQFDINSDTDFDYGSYDSSNHCNAPTNTTNAAEKRTDTCHSAYAGRGGYRRIEHASNAMDDASDLLSLMTSGGTMCPDESDCSETVGKRISWKELKKQ